MLENVCHQEKLREVFVYKGLDDFSKSITVIDPFLSFNSYRNRILITLENPNCFSLYLKWLGHDFYPLPFENLSPKLVYLVLKQESLLIRNIDASFVFEKKIQR